MRIIGHGIDLVPVARIAKMLAEHDERFLERVFTPNEIADCDGHRRQAERLAARFAAKEAALKALGTGLTRGITFRDVAIVTEPTGRPTLALAGAAAAIAAELGITAWHVSLTDTAEYSMASVIATGD